MIAFKLCWCINRAPPLLTHGRQHGSRFQIRDPFSVPGPSEGTDISGIISMSGRVRKLLGNELFSDAAFLVGPNKKTAKKIPVHTFMLRMASDAFVAMFSGNWKDEPVHIPDYDASTVFSLLRWIYCEELVFEAENLIDVLRIAHKYLVESLISFVIVNFANVETKFLWSILSFSIEIEPPKELAHKCANLIIANPIEHFASDDFLQASAKSVTAIVSRDLKMMEMDIFKRCLQWADKESGRRGVRGPVSAYRRKMLEPFIYEFAFPAMDATEFAGLPCESGILTDAEQAQILRMTLGIKLESPFRKIARTSRSCRYWKAQSTTKINICIRCRVKLCPGCFNDNKGSKNHACMKDYDRFDSSYVWRIVDGNLSFDECAGKI